MIKYLHFLNFPKKFVLVDDVVDRFVHRWSMFANLSKLIFTFSDFQIFRFSTFSTFSDFQNFQIFRFSSNKSFKLTFSNEILKSCIAYAITQNHTSRNRTKFLFFHFGKFKLLLKVDGFSLSNSNSDRESNQTIYFV